MYHCYTMNEFYVKYLSFIDWPEEASFKVKVFYLYPIIFAL